MNKMLKLALGCSLLSSVAMAEGVFLGVEGDYMFSSNLKVKGEGGIKPLVPDPNGEKDITADASTKFDKRHFGLGFKAGYDFDDFKVYGAYNYNPSVKARKSLSYNYNDPVKPPVQAQNYKVSIDLELKRTTHQFLIGADYTPKFSEMFRGVFGVYGGYASLNGKFGAFVAGKPLNSA